MQLHFRRWMSIRWTLGRARLAVVMVLLGAGGAGAQERPDTTRRDSTVVLLDEVVVSAVRPATTTGGASAVAVNPDSLRLAPAPTLEQVLRRLPFVSVRQNSRGEAELSVRGSESRQVALLVDGIPITLGWDHRTDPSVVPLGGARRLLLVRGLHSLLFGPNVLGGVVEVGVASGPADDARRELRLRAGADHVGGSALSVAVARPVALPGGGLVLRAGAGYRDQPGTPLAQGVVDPSADGLRTNSDLRQADGFAAARYQGASGGWLGVSASGYRAERGVAPELHLDAPRLWRYPSATRALAVLSGGTGNRVTPFGHGDLEASLGFDAGATRLESYRTPSYREVVGTERSDDRTLTMRLIGDHSLPGGAALRGAFTLAEVRHDEAVDEAPPLRYRQRLWSLGSEATLPLPARSRISGGVVLDGADTPESGDKPALDRLQALGARLGYSRTTRDDRLRVHAALTRRARFPSLRELYSGSLGRFVPNPALRPERLTGAEAGVTLRLPGAELQAVGFHHRLDDAIVRASVAGGRFRRENRERILSSGVELLADWSWRRWNLLGDLTLQDVRLADPAAPGSERHAEHQPAVRAGVNASLPLPLRLEGLLRATYTGRQHCIHPELRREVELGGRGSADLAVRRGWRRGGRAVHATVSVDNLTDAALYDQCGLPRPGRTLRLGLELG